MKNAEKESILAKWLAGDLEPNEQKAFEKRKDAKLLKRIVKETDAIQLPKPDLKEKFEQQVAFNEQFDKQKSKPNIFHIKPWVYAVAASVLLVIGITLFWERDTITTTGLAENKTLTLPDGSTVIMNADTELSYNAKDFLSDRRLRVNGEAYFIVQKASRFQVSTANGVVQVLGTKFNVFSRKSDLSVFCNEGKVAVKTKSNQLLLTAGLGAFKNQNSTLEFFDESIDGPQWRSGKSSYNSAPLSRVFAEIERQFNVDIEVSAIDRSRKYSGTFMHQDIEEALKAVCRPMNIEYTINGNTIELTNK